MGVRLADALQKHFHVANSFYRLGAQYPVGLAVQYPVLHETSDNYGCLIYNIYKSLCVCTMSSQFRVHASYF